MKHLRTTFGRFATVAVILIAATSLSGCSIPIGPFGFNLPLGIGVFNASSLGLQPGVSGTGQQSFSLCLLTLIDVEDLLVLAAGDLARFIEVTDLQIVSITFTATLGDFSGLDEITVWIQPKDVDGNEQAPILLGSATAPHDPINSIQFEVEGNLNLLDIIEGNDENSEPGCPELIIEVTGTIDDTIIGWTGDVEVDGFGVISF